MSVAYDQKAALKEQDVALGIIHSRIGDSQEAILVQIQLIFQALFRANIDMAYDQMLGCADRSSNRLFAYSRCEEFAPVVGAHIHTFFLASVKHAGYMATCQVPRSIVRLPSEGN